MSLRSSFKYPCLALFGLVDLDKICLGRDSDCIPHGAVDSDRRDLSLKSCAVLSRQSSLWSPTLLLLKNLTSWDKGFDGWIWLRRLDAKVAGSNPPVVGQHLRLAALCWHQTPSQI